MPLETLQNGRYRIIRPLGSGSMGEVYLVDDTRINRQVAIKVIRTEAAPYPDSGTNAAPDAARLFEREAKAIARLNHPNILPLYDFGEENVNNTPITFMVMPYCPDGSLASWLQARGLNQPLALQDVAHILHQAADALQHAHDNDIIHQDVKPQNFLLRSNKKAGLPDLLLADFGIAKLAAGTSGASQAIRGTPIYMAPEQWEGQPVPASDQYSLAVMIYQLLTGRPPFTGGPGQMMYQHFNVSPPPPSSINPAINTDIDAALLRALAKRPEARFPSMSAFDHAFQQAVALDGSTLLTMQNALNRPAGDGIRATLAISNLEAVNGTSRTLTLANGQRIRITLPAGMQNGQLLRVDGQDATNSNSDLTVPLLLTIAIAPTGPNFSPIPLSGDKTFSSTPFMGANTSITNQPTISSVDAGRTSISNNSTIIPNDDRTSISSNPTILSNVASSPTPPPSLYYSGADFNNAGGVPPFQNQNMIPNQPPRRRKSPPLITLLIIGLVLLIIIGSASFAFYSYSSNAVTNANATSTALANNSNSSNTATSQLNGTNTALTNTNATATGLQATVNAQATATANAQNKSNANATATANGQNNANATATAVTQTNINANATATAVSGTQTATATTTFAVQSINITVSPTSISGIACGTYITVTYTATFVVASNSPGGTVQFMYTTDNGHSDTNATLTFAPGDTTKTYTFTWSGNLPADHTYPSNGIIITSSPNSITSNSIAPTGQCT